MTFSCASRVVQHLSSLPHGIGPAQPQGMNSEQSGQRSPDAMSKTAARWWHL